MRPLVALGDLLSDIVEGLLRRRSPRAWFLTWRAWFLALFRQRAALLFAPPGRWATGILGSGALRRWKLLLTLLRGFALSLRARSRDLIAARMRVHQGESAAGSPAPERRRRAIRSSTSPSHLLSRLSRSSFQSSRNSLSARTRWTARMAWSISES